MLTHTEQNAARQRRYYIRHKTRVLQKAKEYRAANKEKYTAYHREYKKSHAAQTKRIAREGALRRKDFLWGLKHNPCADCGDIFPAPAMDFDHIDSETKYNVASEFSPENLVKEVSKCQLVCANCHRIRTWKRQNGFSLRTRTSELFC